MNDTARDVSILSAYLDYSSPPDNDRVLIRQENRVAERIIGRFSREIIVRSRYDTARLISLKNCTPRRRRAIDPR